MPRITLYDQKGLLTASFKSRTVFDKSRQENNIMVNKSRDCKLLDLLSLRYKVILCIKLLKQEIIHLHIDFQLF